jgi:hypothetical protein
MTGTRQFPSETIGVDICLRARKSVSMWQAPFRVEDIDVHSALSSYGRADFGSNRSRRALPVGNQHMTQSAMSKPARPQARPWNLDTVRKEEDPSGR